MLWDSLLQPWASRPYYLFTISVCDNHFWRAPIQPKTLFLQTWLYLTPQQKIACGDSQWLLFQWEIQAVTSFRHMLYNRSSNNLWSHKIRCHQQLNGLIVLQRPWTQPLQELDLPQYRKRTQLSANLHGSMHADIFWGKWGMLCSFETEPQAGVTRRCGRVSFLLLLKPSNRVNYAKVLLSPCWTNGVI